MEIIVLGQVIDTKKITDIYDIERDKRMFLNREAGFVIAFMDGSKIRFGERISYYSYASEISQIKKTWAKLQKEVTEKWDQYKPDLPVFELS